MTYGYRVISKGLDIKQGIVVSRNIIVDVEFEDDTNPGVVVHREKTWAFDLTDISIDDWARKVIATLIVRDANLVAITTNVLKIPGPVDPKTQALTNAQILFNEATRKAQVALLNDIEAQAAFDALKLAEAAAK